MADDAIPQVDTPAGDPPAGDGEDGSQGTPEEIAKGNGQDGEALITYEAFQMPEGVDIDQDALRDFTPVAQKYKLPQEGAQELVNLFGARLKAQTEAHTKTWNEAMGKWQDEAKADSEIGGDNWDRTQTRISLALKKLSPPNSKDGNGKDLGTNPLEEILKMTGMGNHVEFSRLLEKVGMILEDDKIDVGHALGQSTKTGADVMYPNQGK